MDDLLPTATSFDTPHQSSPFNKFATNSKFVIILVFSQQADPAHLKLMDRNSVTTFSHYSDLISWSFSLVHISHYEFIVTNFHEFLFTMSEMFSELDLYFLVVCKQNTFSHSFTWCNINLVCGAYTYSSIWADTLESCTNFNKLWTFLVWKWCTSLFTSICLSQFFTLLSWHSHLIQELIIQCLPVSMTSP
jgi:hypothetical protein